MRCASSCRSSTSAPAPVEERFATARRIVEFGAESNVLGSALINYWEELGEFETTNPASQLSREAGSTVISRIDHESRLADLASAASFVNRGP